MTRKYADSCAIDGCDQPRCTRYNRAEGRRWYSALCQRHYNQRKNLLARLRRRDVKRLAYRHWRDEARV